MIKICIPYCEHRGIDSRTIDFVNSLDKELFKLSICCGHFLDDQRNSLINDRLSIKKYQLLESKFTHYLMVDSDNSGTLEDINKLKSYNLPVISAAYIRRQNKYQYVAGSWGDCSGIIGNFLNISSKGLKRVDWCGLGFCLIQKDVFERMIYPWFEPTVIEYDDMRVLSSDDAGFCLKCEKLGIPIYVDFDIVVNHYV